MKHLYTVLLLSLLSFTSQAQFIEFDFDNATVTGNTMTQDVFLNGDGYRLTAVHGSTSSAALYDNGGGDLFLEATGGSRPEQKWTITLIKNGSSENFDFISADYLNVGSSTHTFVLADGGNNVITGQTNIPPSNAGTLTPDASTAANALNISTFNIVGLSFFATIDTYFNNLRIRPVSLLSNEDVQQEAVSYFQDSSKNLILSHNNLEGAEIKIWNMNGQLISENLSESISHKINVADFANGLYIARVTLGYQVQTIKFTK